MKREEAIAKFEHLYRIFRQDRYGVLFFSCFYCGDPADELDHQPPITRISDYRSLGLAHELYIKVPSCGECNRILADEITQDLLDREAILKNRLAKKYGKALRSRTWTDEDIAEAELRGNLKKYISGHERKKRRIESRIDYSGGVRAFLEWIRTEGMSHIREKKEEAA